MKKKKKKKIAYRNFCFLSELCPFLELFPFKIQNEILSARYLEKYFC